MKPDVTYCGQRPDQGELTPHHVGGEGVATLQCGGTTVHLGYSALHLLATWAAAGAKGFPHPVVSEPILAAI